MIIAKQNIVIFGQLFEKDKEIKNNINGKILSNEEIKKKLDDKGYKYKIIETKKYETDKINKIKKEEIKNDSRT